jgi:hypothetical protein
VAAGEEDVVLVDAHFWGLGGKVWGDLGLWLDGLVGFGEWVDWEVVCTMESFGHWID